MQIEKQKRSGKKEIDDYIISLEDWIEGFNASNIKKLIDACDNMAGIIADDIVLLSTNQDDETIDSKLQMLGSKKNKIYERYLALIGQIKHFKAVHDILEEIKPKSATKQKESLLEPETEQEEEHTNIQDYILKNGKTS